MTNDTEYWKRQADRLYGRVLADVRIIVQNLRYISDEITTIQLRNSVVKALKQIKKYPRETYSEVILGDSQEAQFVERLGSMSNATYCKV